MVGGWLTLAFMVKFDLKVNLAAFKRLKCELTKTYWYLVEKADTTVKNAYTQPMG